MFFYIRIERPDFPLVFTLLTFIVIATERSFADILPGFRLIKALLLFSCPIFFHVLRCVPELLPFRAYVSRIACIYLFVSYYSRWFDQEITCDHLVPIHIFRQQKRLSLIFRVQSFLSLPILTMFFLRKKLFARSYPYCEILIHSFIITRSKS